MDKLPDAYRDIQRLGTHQHAGALVVAEQLIDDHIAVFTSQSEKLAALDKLASYLGELEQLGPKDFMFFIDLHSYIGVLRDALSS